VRLLMAFIIFEHASRPWNCSMITSYHYIKFLPVLSSPFCSRVFDYTGKFTNTLLHVF
jgi:hypothetical protein